MSKNTFYLFAAFALIYGCESPAPRTSWPRPDDGPNRSDRCDCYAECESSGFACADQDTCSCGDVLDDICADGAGFACYCAEPQCTEEEWLDMYTQCYRAENVDLTEAVVCFAVYDDTTCAEAADACLE